MIRLSRTKSRLLRPGGIFRFASFGGEVADGFSYCVRPNSGRIEPGQEIEVQGRIPLSDVEADG